VEKAQKKALGVQLVGRIYEIGGRRRLQRRRIARGALADHGQKALTIF
jgi:hypothetical protein